MAEILRRKFIIISVSSVFIVLSFITAFINISNYMQVLEHSDDILSVLDENDGHFPKAPNPEENKIKQKMSPEAPFSTRFFTVKIDNSGNIFSVDTGKIFAITGKQAIELSQNVIKKDKDNGFIYNYRYEVLEKEYGKLIIFLDCTRDLQVFSSFLFNSVMICLLGVFAVFILVLFLSKKAIAPIVESYEKQKQFITDVSHELKTPLAVIKTNTEVLEIDYGKNQWSNNISNQTDKLSDLVSQLVSLTKIDEEQNALEKIDFSISDAIIEVGEPFISLANANGKSIDFDIEKNITYCGNEQGIRQLVSILLDNAIKYSSDKDIYISLKKQGKKLILSTKNTASNLVKGNYDALFERFYRPDFSRNSSLGGYGIGLSIAKAIVIKHKGKITAESPDGNYLIITAVL